MKIFYVLLFVIVSEFTFAQNYKKVEIFFNSKSDLTVLREQLDHFSKKSSNSVTAFVSEDELHWIEEKNFHFDVLIDNWNKYYNDVIIPQNKEFAKTQTSSLKKSAPKNFDYGTMGGFYRLDEVYARLDSMYKLFPNLITTKQIIGKTNENRDIYAVKISDNPESDEDEPEAMFTALHHAREPESMMQMIYFMWHLLENYETDPEIKFLVDNREIYFIPVVNPDGYFYNESTNPSGGGMWRKNRRENGDGTYGVDLNRNYGPYEYWNSPNGGSSVNPSSDTYRGTAPFSEPETQAIKNFLAEHNIKNCLNYHTYSDLLIYPYGALGKETPDSLIFRDFAKDMTQYNGYVYGTDDQTVGYTTRGNSDDYFYDGDTITNGKIFAMTPEVGNGSDGFWPLQSRIIPLAEENLFPNLYWVWVAGGYVNISNLSYSKNDFIQNDTVHVSVSLKHKGLGNLGSFNVRLESLNDELISLSNSFDVDSMHQFEEITFQNAFDFVISSNAVNGAVLQFKVIISAFGIDISSQEYSFVVGKPTYVFADKIESTSPKWNSSTGWAYTTKSYFSPDYSFTDSPNGFYLPDRRNELTLQIPIDLSGIPKPRLSFQTKFDIENNWDYGQVLISKDLGSNWKAVGGKLSNNSSGEFQPINSPVYDGKLNNWTKEEIDLSEFANEQILIKFILVSDSYVEFDGWYIDDISVYYYTLTDAEDEIIPNDFVLYQNYPNPFNPTTIINFVIPNKARNLKDNRSTEYYSVLQNVTLKVYDVLGREVATLVNEQKPAGNYEVKFDASKLSSGIYFYTLTAGSKNITKKMILLR